MIESWLLDQGKTFLFAKMGITGTSAKLGRLTDHADHHLFSDFHTDPVAEEEVPAGEAHADFLGKGAPHL